LTTTRSRESASLASFPLQAALAQLTDPHAVPFRSVAHHQILVHAHSVDLYRRKYQPTQNGRIGITLNIDWAVPIDDSPEAKDAADLAIAMALGWVSSLMLCVAAVA
jgi:beta-glucosidase/6-phospho-beta-glucosidase/beta-galactosidase